MEFFGGLKLKQWIWATGDWKREYASRMFGSMLLDVQAAALEWPSAERIHLFKTPPFPLRIILVTCSFFLHSIDYSWG